MSDIRSHLGGSGFEPIIETIAQPVSVGSIEEAREDFVKQVGRCRALTCAFFVAVDLMEESDKEALASRLSELAFVLGHPDAPTGPQVDEARRELLELTESCRGSPG